MGKYNVKMISYPTGYDETHIFSHDISYDFEIEKEIDRSRKSIRSEKALINSVNRSKTKIFQIAISNNWDYFVTLTFNKDYVDRYNYDDCVKKLSKWLNNLRRDSPFYKYLIVPEQHQDGAFHFHGLFSDCYGIIFNDSGHKTKTGDIIYNIDNYKIGFTTATVVKDLKSVCYYITKYITKDICRNIKDKKRYWYSKNCNKPDIYCYDLSDDEKIALEWELRENNSISENYIVTKFGKGIQYIMNEEVNG